MPNKKSAGIRKVGDRQFEIDHIVIINGKRVHIRAKGFSSAQEAKDALPALIEAKRRAIAPTTTAKTFDGLCGEYISYRDRKIKAQTSLAESYLISKHILPSFTGLAIPQALSFDRVSQWYDAMRSSTKTSPQRKNKIFGVMRQIIDCAWKWRYLSSDAHQDAMAIIENVRTPNRASNEVSVWTYEHERRFLEAIPKDSIDYPMFTLFCYLGCRLGEFQGLQWQCFNPKQGTITIGQQVVRLNGGTVLTDELKTNESYRVNQLDRETLGILLRYMDTLNSHLAGEYMFPSPYDTRRPISRTEFRRRFNRYIEISGVPKIAVHGVRHSKATMLASVCRNAEEVAVGARFLGHSASMFMDTYVSQTGISQEDLIGRLSSGRNEA